jgi:hypothetical protein
LKSIPKPAKIIEISSNFFNKKANMKRIVFASVIALLVASTLLSSKIVQSAQLSSLAYPTALVKDWVRTWGGTSNDSVHNVAVDPSGNIYIIGEYAGTVDFDPNPLKTDSRTSTNNNTDAFLSKFAPDGTFLWVKTWGGGPASIIPGVGRDVANGVGIDSQGNVYVSGPYQYTVDFNPDPNVTISYTSNATSMNNIYLSKFAPDGTFYWVKTWGPSDGGAESYNLTVDAADNIYVVGDFSGTTDVNFNPWDPEHPDSHRNHPKLQDGFMYFDAFLSKFDPSGNLQWAKTWGGEGYDDGPGVVVDGLGNVYVSGMYSSQDVDFDPGDGVVSSPAHDSGSVVDVFLSKFSADGSFQWVKTWGGQGKDDVGQTVAVDGDNNIYIAGRFASINCDFDPGNAVDPHSSNGDLDAFISKLDSSGNFLWARTWGGPGWDAPGDLQFDQSGNVFVAGFFVNTVNFAPGGSNIITSNGGRDAFFSKFSSDGAYLWTKTWGGSGEDSGINLTTDQDGNTYIVGGFSSIVNFDPAGGVDNRTSNGQGDAYIIRFMTKVLSNSVYLPLIKTSPTP